MKNINKELLTIAKAFINQLKLRVVYASIGGSVAREEADENSDIDLTIYTDSMVRLNRLNMLFSGEIIQLEICHINELPTKKAIMTDP